MTDLLDDYGLLLLFAIIAAQAAGVGGPPGKTSLVTAAILAARGHFEITHVIVVAAAAGILGGYVGYVIGRVGGRRLVDRPAVQQRLGRALGSIGFAVGFGLAGYYGGEGAIELAERFGIYALMPVALLALAAWWGYKVLRPPPRARLQ